MMIRHMQSSTITILMAGFLLKACKVFEIVVPLKITNLVIAHLSVYT